MRTSKKRGGFIELAKGDIWIVLLDIIAVNMSYFLALMTRFYVNGEFRTTVSYYLTDWAKFTPFYTLLALITFAAFRLYGGMWRYAGINDMNRIIGANAVTVLIQVIGTALFIRRMPITYYIIGAILQFLAVSLIRFGYRILLVEKKKVAGRNAPAVPSMIIGAGETARKAIRHLEDTPFRAAVVVDEASAGKTLDGIPLDLPLYIDMELTGDYPNGRSDRLSAGERADIVEAFCETVRAAGYDAGLYASEAYLRYSIDEEAVRYLPLWMASYTVDNKLPSYIDSYDVWQQSDSCRAGGVDGPFDFNIVF